MSVNSIIKRIKTDATYQRLLVLGVLILASGLFAVNLGQDENWDHFDYHYYNGFAALHHRYFWDIAAAEVQSFLNPVFDIINYLMIAHLKPAVTVFLWGALTGLYGYILYETALLLLADIPARLRTFYALCATAIGVTGSGGIAVIGIDSNDNKMAVLVMLSLYLGVRALLAPS